MSGEATRNESWGCDYCEEGSLLSGIHCPSDYDDREPSRDGKIFVAKCDACDISASKPAFESVFGKERAKEFKPDSRPHYGSDQEAAEKIAEVTGWIIYWSKDCDDALDPDERVRAKGQPWARPYFAVTIAEVNEVMDRRAQRKA
jgi:hypothetical protein